MSEDLAHDFYWRGVTQVCGKCGKHPSQVTGYGDQIMPCRPPRQMLAEAPLGTRAPCIIGGYWTKVAGGWQAMGGDVFPGPSGDWTGELIYPTEST